MDYSDIVERLVNLFNATDEEKGKIEDLVLECYDMGYAQGLEDAEIMFSDF